MGFDKMVQIFYVQNWNIKGDFMAENARYLVYQFTLCGLLELFSMKDTIKMQFFLKNLQKTHCFF